MPQFEISKTPPSSSKMEVSLPPQIPADLTSVKADTAVIKSNVLSCLDAPISAVLAKLNLMIGDVNPYHILFPEVVNGRISFPPNSTGNYFVTDGFVDWGFHSLIGNGNTIECGAMSFIEGNGYIEVLPGCSITILLEIQSDGNTQLVFAKIN